MKKRFCINCQRFDPDSHITGMGHCPMYRNQLLFARKGHNCRGYQAKQTLLTRKGTTTKTAKNPRFSRKVTVTHPRDSKGSIATTNQD